jgi:hypothetical protein
MKKKYRELVSLIKKIYIKPKDKENPRQTTIFEIQKDNQDVAQ